MNEGSRPAPVPPGLPGSYVPPTHPLPPVGPGPGQGPFLGQDAWMGGPPPPPYSMIPGSCPPEFAISDPLHPSSFNQNFGTAPPPPAPHGFLHPHHHHPHHHPFDPRAQQPLFPKAISNSPGFGAAPFSTNSPFPPHLPCPPPATGYNNYAKSDRLAPRPGSSDPSGPPPPPPPSQDISPEGLTARLLDKTATSSSGDASMATVLTNSREGTPGNSVGYRPWEQAGGQDPHSVQPSAQSHTPQGLHQEMSHAQRPPSAQPDKAPTPSISGTPESMAKTYGAQEFATSGRGQSSGETTHSMNNAPPQFSSGPSASDGNTQQEGMQSTERMPTPSEREKYQSHSMASPHPNTQYNNSVFQPLSGSQTFASSGHHMSYHPGQQVNSGYADSKQMKIVEADSSSSSSDIRGNSENYQVPSTSPVSARSTAPNMPNMSHGAEHWESGNSGGQTSMPSQENEKVTKKKRKRCGECPGCLKKDNCGECGPCRSVRSHQICKMRKCDQLKTKKEKEQDSSWLFGTGKRRKGKCSGSGGALSTKERQASSAAPPLENSPMEGGGGNCQNGNVPTSGAPSFQSVGGPENQGARQTGVQGFPPNDYNLLPPQPHKAPPPGSVPSQGSPNNNMFDLNPHFGSFSFSQSQQQQQQQVPQQHISPYNGHMGHDSTRTGPTPPQMMGDEGPPDSGASRHQMMHHRLKSLIQSRQTQKDHSHGAPHMMQGRYAGHPGVPPPPSGSVEPQPFMNQPPQSSPCPPSGMPSGPMASSPHSVNHQFPNHQLSPLPVDQSKQHNPSEVPPPSWPREPKREQMEPPPSRSNGSAGNTTVFEHNGQSVPEKKGTTPKQNDASDRPYSRDGENPQASGYSVQRPDQPNDPSNGMNYSAFYGREAPRDAIDSDAREGFGSQGPNPASSAPASAGNVHSMSPPFTSQSGESQGCNSAYVMTSSGAYHPSPAAASSGQMPPPPPAAGCDVGPSSVVHPSMSEPPTSRTEHLPSGYNVRSLSSPADTRTADNAPPSGNGPSASGAAPSSEQVASSSENNEESIDAQPFLSNTTTSMNTYTSIINSFNLSTSSPYLSFTTSSSSKPSSGPSVITSIPTPMSSPEHMLITTVSRSSAVTASPLTGGDSIVPSVDGGRIRDSAAAAAATSCGGGSSLNYNRHQPSSLPPLSSTEPSPVVSMSSFTSRAASVPPTSLAHTDTSAMPPLSMSSLPEQGWWERLERLRNNIKMEVPPCDCFGDEEREYPSLNSPTLPTLPATL